MMLAQRVNIGGNPIQGPLVGINTLGDIVNKLLPIVIGVASIILLLVMIWGGYDFILSRGNPEKVKTARAKITAGAIGFALLVLSFLITRVISQVFGLGQNLFQ